MHLHLKSIAPCRRDGDTPTRRTSRFRRVLALVALGASTFTAASIAMPAPSVSAACTSWSSNGQTIKSVLGSSLGRTTARASFCYNSSGYVTSWDSYASTWSANGWRFKRWNAYQATAYSSSTCSPYCKRNWFDGVYGGASLQVWGIGFSNEDNSDRGLKVYRYNRVVGYG